MSVIEIFNSSPRKNGNTAFLAGAFSDTAESGLHKCEINNLYDYDILPCIDCRACKKDNFQCALKDDMNRIYMKMESADILVFGTPIYWYGPTAKMKLLIDRLRPYFGSGKLKGKKGILMMSAGSGKEDCDLTGEMFKRIFDALGITMHGVVITKSYDVGDAQNDAAAVENMKLVIERIKKD